MNTTTTTLSYYNTHAEDFVSATASVDFSALQEAFLSHLPKQATVLDVGCGSGRDSKAFLAHGCKVTAIDGSEALCALASAAIGQPVLCTTFQAYRPDQRFDGIWACASLLHLEWDDLIDVMTTLAEALVPGGCFYASFKYGSTSETRNGRFFTDMTESRFEALLAHLPALEPARCFITPDARPGRENERWLNVFLIKR